VPPLRDIAAGAAAARTSSLPLDCRLDIVQREDTHFVVVPTAGVRNHLQLVAVRTEVVVVEIEGAAHATTWYERDPVKIVESAMSLSGSALEEARFRKCHCTQHLVARTRQGRCHKAGNSGYAGPPSLPCSQVLRIRNRRIGRMVDGIALYRKPERRNAKRGVSESIVGERSGRRKSSVQDPIVDDGNNGDERK
jgi:hypothetical protein